MNQAEIIGPEIQRNSGFEVSQLARESQGQPVKTSDFHSEREVLPFDIGGTDLAALAP